MTRPTRQSFQWHDIQITDDRRDSHQQLRRTGTNHSQTSITGQQQRDILRLLEVLLSKIIDRHIADDDQRDDQSEDRAEQRADVKRELEPGMIVRHTRKEFRRRMTSGVFFFSIL